MRTESDLRAALGELADAEPVTRAHDEADGDAVRPLVARRAHRSRRWLAPAGASAAVIAVVAGTIVVHQSEHDGLAQAGSPTPQPSTISLSLVPGTAQTPPPSTFTFDPTKPWLSCRAPAAATYAGIVTHADSAVTFGDTTACGSGARAVSAGTAGGPVEIMYLPPEMLSPDLLTNAPRVSANGISGWSVGDIASTCENPQLDPCPIADGFVWEYTPDAYAIGYGATADNTPQPLTTAVLDRITMVANRVEPGTASAALAPVVFTDRLGALRVLDVSSFASAPGYPPETVPSTPGASSTPVESGPGVDVQLGFDGAGTPCPADTVCDPGVDVNLGYDVSNHPGEAVIIPVQGADDGVLRGTCGHFTFDATRYGTVTPEQLQQVVLGMHCAPSADMSTWTPITG